MHASSLRSARLATALTLACASGYALAADCERAIASAMTVADYGQRAFASNYQAEAANFASDARIPAIDAAQQAKACGCPEAMPFLAEAARDAARSNATANGTAAQQYGASIRKHGDAALDALRRCASR
jgi:hypothetical protein